MARLRRLEALSATIAAVIGPGVVFSAGELWEAQAVSLELAAALEAAGIHSARSLGKRLRQLCGSGIERHGQDHAGAWWTCAN